MPEGHSVHRIARQFEANYLGTKPEVTSPQGRFSEGAKLITGRELTASKATGKQLFLEFDEELWLRVHLGIYGAWDFSGEVRVHPTIMVHGTKTNDEEGEDSTFSIGAPRKTRVRMAEEDVQKSTYFDFPPEPVGQVRARLLNDTVCADLRGPTACEVITAGEKDQVLLRLGPDPANDSSDSEMLRFVDRAKRKKTPIGLVLMDQNVIAGIGNVYRAEMLFRAGIDPHRPANTLTDEELQGLWHDWVGLLEDGIHVGQMITVRDLQGEEFAEALRERDARHYVYRLNGRPCKVCGTNIILEEMAARKLYYCPVCQN